jgi:maltooligosyltrehalose trehalohydrolase
MGLAVTSDGVTFRVWAPSAGRVRLAAGGAEHDMERQADGTWVVSVPAGPGLRYGYRLDDGQRTYPDPYSRFQPEGVHGPSEVVDASGFQWRHRAPGVSARELVIYELHTGTFSPEGTFDAALSRLPDVAALGVNAIELMPVAEFAGSRNWGYDGVDWFAPSHRYGDPDALRRLVDGAHGLGLVVLLDVVYNHFGPAGNYLSLFSKDYFTERYQTPWGAAINYEGCVWARRLAIDSALHWLRDYHVDGFRLDATFAIKDGSPRHLLAELSDAVRAEKPDAILVAETDENDPRYFAPTASGGYGFDACWADDFHHVLRRTLAGDHEGYYRDYAGGAAELARTINQGFLYEGQTSTHSGRPRGGPPHDASPSHFVYCIQNHDQVGNRAMGERLRDSVGLDAYRAASMLLLLLPYTPLLFMGQEFAAATPFLYFTDHEPDLGTLVTEGRRGEFQHFSAFADPAARARIPDPQAEATFQASKLNWGEAANTPGREIRDLYAAALRLRREYGLANLPRDAYRASALPEGLLAVRLGPSGPLLAANLSRAEQRVAWSDLGAPPATRVLLDSNDGRYGGSGKRSAQVDGSGLTLDRFSAALLNLSTAH